MSEQLKKSENSSENIDYYLNQIFIILETERENKPTEMVEKLHNLIYQISEEAYYHGLTTRQELEEDEGLKEIDFFGYAEELRDSLDTDELDFMVPNTEGYN